jgi:hypothetical protein
MAYCGETSVNSISEALLLRITVQSARMASATASYLHMNIRAEYGIVLWISKVYRAMSH